MENVGEGECAHLLHTKVICWVSNATSWTTGHKGGLASQCARRSVMESSPWGQCEVGINQHSTSYIFFIRTACFKRATTGLCMDFDSSKLITRRGTGSLINPSRVSFWKQEANKKFRVLWDGVMKTLQGSVNYRFWRRSRGPVNTVIDYAWVRCKGMLGSVSCKPNQ